ncbi:UBP-type zinc finger domain-containing protein [Micromonospora sp. DT233]|uniref:UBP-type zinc finger domain-containing protein n=1 Tax=Micromonospora sp. DT233 TaxID=3393432 RepID=UPI003CEC2544
MSCEHLERAGAAEPVTTSQCPGCVAAGSTEPRRLRACLTCGHVGCCDSSPYRHATRHFEATGHPVMRSVQPGESWRWCYVDEELG